MPLGKKLNATNCIVSCNQNLDDGVGAGNDIVVAGAQYAARLAAR